MIWIYGYFGEDVEAVVRREEQVFGLVSRQAVDVEAELPAGAVEQFDAVYADGFVSSVIDFEDSRCRAQFGKSSVKAQGIGREAEGEAGIVQQVQAGAPAGRVKEKGGGYEEQGDFGREALGAVALESQFGVIGCFLQAWAFRIERERSAVFYRHSG